MPTDTLTLEQIYALDAAEDIGGGARIRAALQAAEERGDRAVAERDLWKDEAAMRAANAELWRKRHESDSVVLTSAEARCAELERELDEARAELAAECMGPAGALPGWRAEMGDWVTDDGGLVRLGGTRDEDGALMWHWHTDEADEGDPAHVEPTARRAMRAADAARAQARKGGE